MTASTLKLTTHDRRAHWIMEWMRAHSFTGAGASSDDFNADYETAFPGGRRATSGGLESARRSLRHLYEDGYLDRSRLSNEDARSEGRGTWDHYYFVARSVQRRMNGGECYLTIMYGDALESETCPLKNEHRTGEAITE